MTVGDHIVGQAGLGRRNAELDVSRIEPIVRIEEPDAVVILRDGEKSSDAARRVAVIAMRPVKSYVPDRLIVQPRLRHAVGNHQVIGRHRLPLNA